MSKRKGPAYAGPFLICFPWLSNFDRRYRFMTEMI